MIRAEEFRPIPTVTVKLVLGGGRPGEEVGSCRFPLPLLINAEVIRLSEEESGWEV